MAGPPLSLVLPAGSSGESPPCAGLVLRLRVARGLDGPTGAAMIGNPGIMLNGLWNANRAQMLVENAEADEDRFDGNSLQGEACWMKPGDRHDVCVAYL